jgi:hypothetical protein
MKQNKRGDLIKAMLGIIFTVALVGGVLAQESMGSEINARRGNQQDRIANGVASSQLTAGETARLESQEANLNKEIAKDRSGRSALSRINSARRYTKTDKT